MASACNPGCKENQPRPHTEESPTPLLKNSCDAHLLDEPYAQAVHLMGYHQQDILQAIKILLKRQRSLHAEDVMHELMVMESQNRTRTSAPPSPPACASAPRKCLKRHASATAAAAAHKENQDPLGSDGEEDGEPVEDQGGGGGGGTSPKRALIGAEAAGGVTPGPPLNEKGRKKAELRKKVVALREENRRLRARHLCRKCRQQPVSLTLLPCGHFSFCQPCGESLEICPLCGKTILADVRTYLS